MFRIKRSVYLDNNATTPVSRLVRKRIGYILKNIYGNPSALYHEGRSAAVILEESRAAVADAINASSREIFFVGSATEANNAVLKIVLSQRDSERREVIASPIEHASVMETLNHLVSQGIEVSYLPVSAEGRVDPAQLEAMISSRTTLVTVMLANNEIGTLQDLRSIVDVARAAGARVMADCVQAFGKIPLDVQALGVDYATLSAHKVHGPKGVGALYVREGSPHRPLIHGGHQESGMRAGTEGLHNIAGFAEACKAIPLLLKKAQKLAELKRFFIKKLKEIAPNAIINSTARRCLDNTISARFPGRSNAQIIAALDHYGVSVAAGSACDTTEDAPSHVLKAIGLTDQQARETIRISLSTYTKPKELSYALRVLGEYLNGKTPAINIVAASQLNQSFLLDPDLYILDVRFWYDRGLLKSLPNAHEISFFNAKKYLPQVPKDKHILVACQNGPNAPFVAYQLKALGHRRVSTIMTGVMGWRVAHPELYKRRAGEGVKRLVIS